MGTLYRVIEKSKGTEVKETGDSISPSSDLLEDGSVDPVKLKVFAHKKELFFQIEKESLYPNTFVDFSIFKQKKLIYLPFIEASSENPVLVQDSHIEDIKRDPRCELAINKKDLSNFRLYINHVAENLVNDEKISSLRKAVAIKENAKIIILDVMSDPRSGERIKEMKGVVNKITDSIINQKDMLFNMLSLSKFDYYTYTHCLNVSVLSIGLALALGIKGRELRHLAFGSVLHDIGKTAIAPEILNKQGKLDEYEYKIIKQHVNDGARMLSENPEFPKDSLNALLHHHEKISGHGYPCGLRDKEISLFGKITGIADCYDALTTARPYKSALSPFQALNIIAREKCDYDGEMLRVFVKMLGKVWA